MTKLSYILKKAEAANEAQRKKREKAQERLDGYDTRLNSAALRRHEALSATCPEQRGQEYFQRTGRAPG